MEKNPRQSRVGEAAPAGGGSRRAAGRRVHHDHLLRAMPQRGRTVPGQCGSGDADARADHGKRLESGFRRKSPASLRRASAVPARHAAVQVQAGDLALGARRRPIVWRDIAWQAVIRWDRAERSSLRVSSPRASRLPAACRTAGLRLASRRCRRCGLKSGRPTDVRFSSGEEIWEYAIGPEGIETYVVVFDGNGLVRSAQQVLTEDNIHRLIPRKTTREETRNLLGRLGDVYPMNGSEVWEWRFKPQGFAPEILVVTFGGDGLVNGVTRVPESFGGGRTGRR